MGLINLIKKTIGPVRWSLYIVRNNKDIIYMMKDNSVPSIVGYLMGQYANGGKPVPPWSLHLRNNGGNKETFQLLPEHFTEDGETISNLLKEKLSSIDEKWLIFEPNSVFIEYKTKKKLKIMNETDYHNLQQEIDNMNKPKDPTFFDILRMVFGEKIKDNIILPKFK